MKLTFECTKSTPSKNGGFVNTLVAVTTVVTKVFGVTKTSIIKETVYMKTDDQIPVGAKDIIDTDDFQITLSDLALPNGQIAQLKWLSAKRGERLAAKAVAHYGVDSRATTVATSGI